ARLTIERWPRWHRPRHASWRKMLAYTELAALWRAQAHGPFWALHHDCDEIRRAHGEETLSQFFQRVQAAGWNAVDHRVELYAPRDGYEGQESPETYFTERVHGHCDETNGQLKAWLQTADARVDLASSGGHRVAFQGRKVCPEMLVVRHFPLRGAE